ncbi:MAG: PRC and DUF2382 domain-containing protein [Actinomycetota bacterium]|nr:PRC and DUF2382 domain-containing protein [Actinomycetota bacterium]
MISNEQATALLGQPVIGPDGEKSGKVGQVFLDDETAQPEWVTVRTGLFGGKESFVPLAQASFTSDALQVPYGKDQVTGAPRVDADQALSQEEEAQLYAYYGLGYTERTSDSGLPATGAPPAGAAGDTTTAGTATTGTAATGRAGGADARDRDGDGVIDAVEDTAVGRDTSGVTSDDAMTRSEERLNVGVQPTQARRVRLRKHMVTEQVQQTVPVSTERATVSREPITAANRCAATAGPALSEEEHEVVLTTERPVVNKETVPVERIRLDKQQVTEQVTVRDEVRKEQIELADAEGTRRDVDSDPTT